MVPLFIETIDEIIWFSFIKFNQYYVCIPKCVRTYKGRNYREWFEDQDDDLVKYKKYLPGIDHDLYLIDEKDIIKKYDPIKFVSKQNYKFLNNNLNNDVDFIIKAISNFFNIEKKYIGIEGSILLGIYKETSDIDIFVYGKRNSKKIQANFRQFDKYKGISLFNDNQTKEYVSKRMKCGFGNDINTLIKQFNRRYYGFANGRQFSIVCVPFENEDAYINLDRCIKYVDEFEGLLKIIDDDLSCVVPSIYKAMDDNGIIYNIEVYNHYGINQIKKNESVYVKGKKYKNSLTNENIIILAFWNNIEERFDLYE